jgi:hypothetical protein
MAFICRDADEGIACAIAMQRCVRPCEIMVAGAVKRTAQGGEDIRFSRIKAVPPGAEAAYRLKFE